MARPNAVLVSALERLRPRVSPGRRVRSAGCSLRGGHREHVLECEVATAELVDQPADRDVADDGEDDREDEGADEQARDDVGSAQKERSVTHAVHGAGEPRPEPGARGVDARFTAGSSRMVDANSASLLARSTRATMVTNRRRPKVGSVVTNTPTAKLATISWGVLSPANARSNSAQVPSR